MSPSTRKPSVVRRREIAEAALRVIGERGASSLTAASLAAEVGLSSGALFRHFASLAEILEAAVDLAIERAEATFPSEDRPPRERLEALARARVELLGQDPGLCWLLLSDEVFLFVPAPAVERLRALVKRSKGFAHAALAEGALDGSVRADLRPEVLLPIFTGTLQALVRARGVHDAAPEHARPPTLDEGIAGLLTLLAPRSDPTAIETS